MHLLALTKRSAFYIEEKRHTEERERHSSRSFYCSPPASKGGHSTEPATIPAAHRETDWTLLSKALTWR